MRFHDIYTMTKTMHNLAQTFQAIIQKIFFKCFLITFRKIFLQRSRNIFYIFSVIKKYLQERFFKHSHSISGNDTGNLLKWFPYNLREIFLHGFGNNFLHFQFYVKSFQERFLKPFRNLSKNGFLRESSREKFRESFVKTCSNTSWNAFSRCQNRVQNVPKTLLQHFRQ